VINSNNKIDTILSAQCNSRRLLSVGNRNYILSIINQYSHLYSIPGFSSAFDSNSDVNKIASDLDMIDFETGYLQFFDYPLCKKFCEIYNAKKSFIKIQQRETIFLDIKNKDKLCILQNFKKGTKQKAKSETQGYQFVYSYTSDFFDLYSNLAFVKSFSSVYCYTKKNLLDLSKSKNIYFIGIKVNDELIAGSFFRKIDFFSNIRFDYLLSATKMGSSSKWIVKVLWEAIKFAIDLDCDIFNFGGGTKEKDSLHFFKLSFGSYQKKFYTCRLINRNANNADFYLESDILNNDFFPS